MAAAIAVITKSGWDTPALRMATKTHHPEFEQMQRKDNALRDAASEIDILRKRNVIQLMFLVAESERLSHEGDDEDDQEYWTGMRMLASQRSASPYAMNVPGSPSLTRLASITLTSITSATTNSQTTRVPALRPIRNSHAPAAQTRSPPSGTDWRHPKSTTVKHGETA